jgi:hypothetical protein
VTYPADTGLTYDDAGICGSVNLAHWQTQPNGSLDICVLTHPCGKMSAFELLCTLGNTISLTLEAPDEPHPRAAPGPHPRINLHLNAGPTYSHDWCTIVDACVDCSRDLYPALFTAQHGTLGRHLSDDEQDLATTYPAHASALGGTIMGNRIGLPFRLVRAEATVHAIDVATARITT